MFPVPDAATAEPSLAAAVARGAAWARDELGDHLAALLDELAGGAGPATGDPVGA